MPQGLAGRQGWFAGTRQRNRKGGAGTGFALHGDGPPVLLDDTVHHCETEAGSLAHLLGREEWREDFRQIFPWDTVTRVGYRKGDRVGRVVQTKTDLATLRHGIDGVDEQIEEHLGHLVRVCVNMWQDAVYIGFNLDAFAGEPVLQHLFLMRKVSA